MTYQELVDQLGTLTGSGDIYSSYQGQSPYSSDEEQAMYALNMFQLLGGNAQQDPNYDPFDPPPGMDFHESFTPPAGMNSWANMFDVLNPIQLSQLEKAKYSTMRPGMEKGRSSNEAELLGNLGRINTGGFASSGLAQRKESQARDIYGKKASDILVSEGQKRQDYMGSLADQVMADRDLLSSWVDYGD